jgi:hypothetical protein
MIQVEIMDSWSERLHPFSIEGVEWWYAGPTLGNHTSADPSRPMKRILPLITPLVSQLHHGVCCQSTLLCRCWMGNWGGSQFSDFSDFVHISIYLLAIALCGRDRLEGGSRDAGRTSCNDRILGVGGWNCQGAWPLACHVNYTHTATGVDGNSTLRR